MTFGAFVILHFMFVACDSGSSSSPEPHLPDAPKPVFNTIVDSRDGNAYRIVKIGEQWWMAENLRFETDSCYDT